MGEVYRAVHVTLGTPIAIKRLRGLSDDPQEQAAFRQQFEREARLLASVSHPNLATVTDFFEEGGHAFILMKLIEGQNLEELVEAWRPWIDEAQALAWAAQVLDALQFLHTRHPPIIVRDLKPSNLMLDVDGRVRLIDFGLARPLGVATRTLVRGLGSEGYAPLEQYGHGATDERSDLYALGATLYFILTRTAPAPATARVALRTALADPRTINPTVSDRTWEALQRLLAVPAADRPASAAEARRLLLGGGELAPGRSSKIAPRPPDVCPSLPPRPVARSSTRRGLRRALWAVALVVAALLGLRVVVSPPEAIDGPRAPASAMASPGTGLSDDERRRQAGEVATEQRQRTARAGAARREVEAMLEEASGQCERLRLLMTSPQAGADAGFRPALSRRYADSREYPALTAAVAHVDACMKYLGLAVREREDGLQFQVSESYNRHLSEARAYLDEAASELQRARAALGSSSP